MGLISGLAKYKMGKVGARAAMRNPLIALAAGLGMLWFRNRGNRSGGFNRRRAFT